MHKIGTTLGLEDLDHACGGMKWQDFSASDNIDDRRSGIDGYARWNQLEPSRERPQWGESYDPYIDDGVDYEGGGDFG